MTLIYLWVSAILLSCVASIWNGKDFLNLFIKMIFVLSAVFGWYVIVNG